MHQNGSLFAVVWAAILLTPQGIAQESRSDETKPAYEVDIRSFGAACDGRDDARAVQAALDALPDRSTLLVSCRAGIGSALALRDRTGVTVRGTRGGGFQAIGPNPSRLMLHVVSCTECTIADLAIDGGNAGVAGIWIERSTNSTVRNNSITNIGFPAQAAIVGFANRNNRYTGNLIANTGVLYDWSGEIVDATRGMWLGNEKPEFYEWYPVVTENRLYHIAGTAIVTHAFSAVIERNVGENLLWSGVKVVAPAGSGGTTRVAGNNFKGAGGRYSGGGIQLGSEPTNGETIVVEDNTIEGDRDSGIYAARGPVTGRFVNNTILNSVQAGITVVTSASKLEIRGNRIVNARPGTHYQGIRVLAEHGLAMRDIEITGNQIRGQTENGILVQSNGGTVEGVTIHSNSLAEVGWYGVCIDEKAPRNSIRNVNVGPNCFVNNGRGPLSDNREGPMRQPATICPAEAPQ